MQVRVIPAYHWSLGLSRVFIGGHERGPMIETKQSNKSKRLHIKTLQKRADWISARIAEKSVSKHDMSYDRAELASLEWAIEELLDLYPDLKEFHTRIFMEVA